MDREINFMKEVWVPSEHAFRFTESIDPQTGKKKFIISGLMLPFGKISRNNIMYNIESIKDQHKKLIGKALMYNHKVDTDMLPKGHFIDSTIEEDGWHYKADVDPHEVDLIRKLERGDLRHVSIQLIGGKVIERMNDKGEPFTEAYVSDLIEGSIVPAPGFLDTTIKLAEAFKPKEQIMVDGKLQSIASEIEQDLTDGKFEVNGDLPAWLQAKGYELSPDQIENLKDILKFRGVAVKEDVTTTTGKGAMPPTQPLEDEDEEKLAEEILKEVSDEELTESINMVFSEGTLIKSDDTKLGRVELWEDAGQKFLVKLNNSLWTYYIRDRKVAEDVYKKVVSDAKKGQIHAPFTYQ